MKHTITESYFVDQIVGDENNNMSYDGAKALFEYLEELEEDCELEIEFDRVAIRCEWNEYDNINEALEMYDDSENCGGDPIETIEDLRDHTQVIEVPNSDKIIIQEF